MEFNQARPNVLCIDINSCFATIEQQANPNIRNKPVVVAAYATNSGSILAASVDAKKLGIKTGMRIQDAKLIYPKLIVLTPDAPKYRFVHKKLLRILKQYSVKVTPKSIDEFMFSSMDKDPWQISLEIKERIKKEIGEYITVSIGISTNRYLAKVASNLKKPDGLSIINADNHKEIFSRLSLTDLTGIKKGNSARLRRVGIKTVQEFYDAPIWKLRLAFSGISGVYWHTRLHGYEIDDVKTNRKTYGNSYSAPLNKAHLKLEILSKLCQKTGSRLRKAGYVAGGIHLAISFRDRTFWHKGVKTKRVIFENGDIYKEALNLLNESPSASLPKLIAVNVFNLTSGSTLQLNMFEDQIKKTELVCAVDSINKRWGLYTVHSARMSNDPTVVQDRIGFGQL